MAKTRLHIHTRLSRAYLALARLSCLCYCHVARLEVKRLFLSDLQEPGRPRYDLQHDGLLLHRHRGSGLTVLWALRTFDGNFWWQELSRQESVANAKVSARQQRVYEGPQRRNPRQIDARNIMLKSTFSELQHSRWQYRLYLRSFSSCCLSNLQNPAKLSENPIL